MGDADEYTLVPPPWALKGTVYLFAFWTTRSQAANPPSFAYSPLEASAGYATPEGSRHLGGLSMIQLIRYTESPVGPYDELILSPGFHEYTVEEAGRRVKKRNARITRIYVSQRQTCWNGRKNWNIPKHLAAFDWQDHQDGSTTIKVYPHDTEPVSAAEASPSKTPFFQTTFRPTPFVPSFPISMSLFKHLGVDATLVQPPLPQGQGSHGELPGTDRWCAVAPDQSSRRSSIGWFDLRQTDDQGNVVGEHENFWPGFCLRERDAAFPCIIQSLEQYFPDRSQGDVKVLLPGAGVGRLGHEVAALGGFEVTTNEWSMYMNLAYRFLEKHPRVGSNNVHPFIDGWSHHASTADMFRGVAFPDRPVNASAVVLVEGDFTTAFKGQNGHFDALVTHFFIDTARNLMSYFETIHGLLRKGGIWVNLGPLLYGTGPYVQLSLDEIIAVVNAMGFEFVDAPESCGELTFADEKVRGREAVYGFNERALVKNAYNAQSWVMRKK